MFVDFITALNDVALSAAHQAANISIEVASRNISIESIAHNISIEAATEAHNISIEVGKAVARNISIEK